MRHVTLQKILWRLCLLAAPLVLVVLGLFHPTGFITTPGMYHYLSRPEPYNPPYPGFGVLWPPLIVCVAHDLDSDGCAGGHRPLDSRGSHCCHRQPGGVAAGMVLAHSDPCLPYLLHCAGFHRRQRAGRTILNTEAIASPNVPSGARTRQ
jgi:hypothetical protein